MLFIATFFVVCPKEEEGVFAVFGQLEPNELDLLRNDHFFHYFVEFDLIFATVEVVHEHVVKLLILRKLTALIIEVSSRMVIASQVAEIVTTLALHLCICFNLLIFGLEES